MENKLVSIIIPCFNSEKWLTASIESCLQQSYKNLEIIVIDDGSTDQTLGIIQKYADKIIWKTGIHKGGNYARNIGLELAKGEYIQFLDSDDYLLTNKIENHVNFLETTGADIVYSDIYIMKHCKNREPLVQPFNKFGFSGNHQNILESLIIYGCLPPIAYLFKKEFIINNNIRWDETLKTDQDRDFLLQTIINDAYIAYMPGFYSVYRKYGNITVSTRNKSIVAQNFLLVSKKVEQQLNQMGKLSDIYFKALVKSYFLKAVNLEFKINLLYLLLLTESLVVTYLKYLSRKFLLKFCKYD